MPETFGPAFEGQSQPLLSFGLPLTESLVKHADDTFHASRIYIICSRSLARNTTYLDDLKEVLGDKVAGVRVGLKPHSLWSEILEIVEDTRNCDTDLIVTLGAGSLTDSAKIISFALANNVSTHAELDTLMPTSSRKRDDIKPSKVPVVCIPTSLSGGEYSAFAGATNDETGQKHTFSGALKSPALVILDPELATTTPEKVWLSTGIKAVDHCVETLCSLKSDDAADRDARHGLAKLIPGLIKTKQNPNNLEARLETQLGARDAMSAATRGVPVGASHGIGHQLGPAGVSHGETSCILNPAVCKYNYKKGANIARQDAISELLWGDSKAREIFEQKNLNRDTADLGDLMDAIIRALGLPRTLREFGIGEDRLDRIAELSLEDRSTKTNPAPLDKEGVLDILKMVLE
ncbi:putative Fe-containing alcohol dehydrogenase [Annulohypoxylon maeteangense]|uniref:putative Fe-containing alcohol dehydrogenase n=1 Tax=Annulohypoxylon maeteangense TaxID=1927788 RepID=UPI002007F36E|nr:putative Fe-containing alcohol dehydrogenase [Annulohypoxylon maeteangense]KAI0887111.1 putative Fe-containing alcohol dehydrogenase [Annulohypoxylon maeteangense]